MRTSRSRASSWSADTRTAAWTLKPANRGEVLLPPFADGLAFVFLGLLVVARIERDERAGLERDLRAAIERGKVLRLVAAPKGGARAGPRLCWLATLSVWPRQPGARVEFVGPGGKVLARERPAPGAEAAYHLRGNEAFVRARVVLPQRNQRLDAALPGVARAERR